MGARRVSGRSYRFAGCVVAAVLAVGLVWGLGAAVATSSSPAPQGKVVLKVGWLAEPDNLNPFLGTTTSAFTVWYMNYDPLVGPSYADLSPTRGEHSLGLATDWTVSPDKKTWTFTIRRNAHWQDGVPVTAADVAFTYNYIIDNDLSSFTSYTQYITHATALDAYHVRFVCSQPKASMLKAWVPILPQHIWSKIPGKQAASYRIKLPLVGSGPFQCVKFQQGQLVRMVANKSYWGGAPKVDEVDFLAYTNSDTMAGELKSGALDACGSLQPAQLKSLGGTAGLTTRAIEVNGFDELAFNCYTGPSLGNPVLKDWRFRQALNYAVDKDKIDQIVYSGNAKPGVTPITTGYYKNPDWAWTPPAGQAYTFDLAKAGAMLTAAGYPLKNGARVDRQGKPIKLRLWARSESPTSEAASKLLAGTFAKLGLKITLSVLDNGTLEDKLYNTVKGTFTPDYDMFLWGWYGDIDPGIILSYFTTGQINSWSDCAWSNKSYDALYLKQGATLDVATRKALLDQMQQIWYQQSPYIILAYSDDIEGWHTDKWGGWIQSPAGVGNVVFSPYGPGSFLYVYPRADAAAGGGGSGTWIAAAVVAALIVAGILVVVARRRRTPREEAEEVA